MKITLLTSIENVNSDTGSDRLVHVMQRNKKFVMPHTRNEMAIVTEMEMNGLLLSLEDTIEFWVEKNMLSREAGCQMVIQYFAHIMSCGDRDLIKMASKEDFKRLQKVIPIGSIGKSVN